jgi:HEPN domain-containing protein
MNDLIEENVKGWVTHADNDRTAVRILLDDGPWEIVCFHAQQAAEKMLKAFMIYHDINPERTHDLSRLLDVALKLDKTLGSLESACCILTPFAVSARYPDDIECEQADAKEAADAAEIIYKEIKDRISETRKARSAAQGRVP